MERIEVNSINLYLVSWSFGVQQEAKRIYPSLGEDVKKLRNILTIFLCSRQYHIDSQMTCALLSLSIQQPYTLVKLLSGGFSVLAHDDAGPV